MTKNHQIALTNYPLKKSGPRSHQPSDSQLHQPSDSRLHQRSDSRLHRSSSFRQKLPLLGLFLGFLFISFATTAIIKNFHHKKLEYLLDTDTCASNLILNNLEKNAICDSLVGKIHFKDFKITEKTTFSTLDDDFLIKIELPVTDFYNSLVDLPLEKANDSDFLAQNHITFVNLDQLTPDKKLLSLNQYYYLDNQTFGARFTKLIIETQDSDQTTQLKEALKTLKIKPQIALTSFVETGVTALTRRLTLKLNQVGNGAYFGEKLVDFLRTKTHVHISNEVSFKNHCQGGYQTMVLCADWRTLDTITTIGAHIIELTGNHNNDAGTENNLKTITKYRSLGLKTVGGGENLAEARKPLDVNESIRLLAYNQSTSSVANGQLATDTTPGANPYSEEQVKLDLQKAKSENKFTIINIQYFECYAYPDRPIAFPACDKPITNQQQFFRHLIDLGADMVVGTSAHQPQTFELYHGKPIYYGLGNLFFDQIYWPDTKRSLILTHYFDNGKYLQTRISPTIYDETFQTRLLNIEESQIFLTRLLNASPKGN